MNETTWLKYHNVFPSDQPAVEGEILVARDVYSPQLDNRRDILVYLPPSYGQEETRRYPVLYMHDGQNLFDQATSYAGEWHVDTTMERLAQTEGLEAIIVGIPNSGAGRVDEYSPFVDPSYGGGLGNQYIGFIINTLKPHIDGRFRTRRHRRATGIVGSSLGGLISLYAYFWREDVFGFAGVMSPALWFARGAIYGYLENASYLPGRIYLDAGTRELGGANASLVRRARSRRYYKSVRRMKGLLIGKGLQPQGDLLYIEDIGAAHNEDAWARRLPPMIRFFLEGVPQSIADPHLALP